MAKHPRWLRLANGKYRSTDGFWEITHVKRWIIEWRRYPTETNPDVDAPTTMWDSLNDARTKLLDDPDRW